MIDLHCHILPGLDDGAPDLETSLAMAQMALADGIETVVATPHVSVDARLTAETIRAATRELNAALSARDIPLTVLPGAEVELHPEVMRGVRQGELMTLADGGKYLLLEPPLVGLPTYLEQVCFELQIAGFIPILAHPERTQLGLEQPQVYQRLAERGCLLQVNSSSLRGSDGRHIGRFAVELIRSRQAHILASDAHNATSRPPVLRDVRQTVARAGDEHTFVEMTELVPSKIIGAHQQETAPGC